MDQKVWPPPSRVNWPNWAFKRGQEVRIGERLYEVEDIRTDSGGNIQVTFNLRVRRIHAR